MAYRILLNGEVFVKEGKVVEFDREEKARAYANKTFRKYRGQKVKVVLTPETSDRL
jgi:hypothetical protein